MSNERVSETKLREMQELAAEARGRQSSTHYAWKVLAAAAVALAAAGIITSLHDIRRYIRMVRM